jgi:hypothetical protein
MCVAKARKLIQLYEKNGIGPERILIIHFGGYTPGHMAQHLAADIHCHLIAGVNQLRFCKRN